jgi:mRNA-degrading endonuclease RelE of RelBE toxin-antitoxin system
MEIQFTEKATKEYLLLDPKICKQADKQFDFLVSDYRHKSLNVKKYNKKLEIWQGRINKSWRFYFHIINDVYYIFDIKNHPK